MSFFASGRILREINHTTVSLIPKSLNPSGVGDYRPISCCNVIYKCITKVVMPWQISKQQTSFIYGRRVSDNILLAQELFRDYHRNKGPPRCALKVDLRKAYDNSNLEFLLKTMETMRFPECVCKWIQECCSSASFSININGELCGFFQNSWGIATR